MDLSAVCASCVEIPRVPASLLSPDQFHADYFLRARPVVITGATDAWPARDWTVEGLVERVGQNKVWVRGKTNSQEYREGKKYTIRKDTFAGYCADLLKGNARARSSYLAVASLQQAFPQLLADVPLPEYLTVNGGKLHLGPYLWVALKGHYEFCHFDPDDNFLVMIRGRKRVRLFGHDLASLYPNPLGSQGKTVQSQVDCDKPDLDRHPRFADARCEQTVLEPGEMLFIPAFYWHQVCAFDTGISLNMFYGDAAAGGYVGKVMREPYRPHFEYWLLNIVEQNRGCDSFPRMLERLPEVLGHFFKKQWHDEADKADLERAVRLVMEHCGIDELPAVSDNRELSKFPPVLKIRGLLHRDGTTSSNK